MITSTINRTRTAVSGVTYDFGFRIDSASDLLVYGIDADGVATLLTTGFTVTFDPDNETGTVTFDSEPSAYEEILRLRSKPYTQGTDFPIREGFSEEDIEGAIDSLEMQIQQLKEITDYCVKLDLTGTVTGITFPTPSAGKALVWNDAEDGFDNSNVDLVALSEAVADLDAAVLDAQASASSASSSASTATSAKDDAVAAKDLAVAAQALAEAAAAQAAASAGSGTPIGTTMQWLTDTPPTAFLICNGAAISRTTYAELFAIIGTTYGVGDGSTTFNLPNMKGKVVVGKDAAQTEFDALGETGGAKTVTLDGTMIPSHTHTMTLDRLSGNSAGVPRAASWGNDDYSNGNASATSNATGGGLAHNNLQPYIVVNFIVKYTNVAEVSVLPVKATGAEIDTGTDDAKFATPKAIADSTLPSRFKVGTYSRNLADATSTVAITGLGFRPKAIYFMGSISGVKASAWGFYDGTSSSGHSYQNDTNISDGAFLNNGGGAYVSIGIASLDSDGFSVTFTKVSSPTGTGSFRYLAFR